MLINNEEIIVLDKFNAEFAFKIGSKLVEMSIREDLKLCIDIFANNKCVFHYCSDKCIPDNDNWLERKRNTVLYFQNSTRFMSNKLKGDQTLLRTKYCLDMSKYSIVSGGYPIYVKNAGFIGSICISGLKPEEDHELVVELLNSSL